MFYDSIHKAVASQSFPMGMRPVLLISAKKSYHHSLANWKFLMASLQTINQVIQSMMTILNNTI